MVNLHIDSYYIACPKIEEGEMAFLQYANSLLEWRDVHKGKDINFFISRNSLETLERSNRYPFWHDLRSAIKIFAIDYIQDKDLNALVEGLLTRSFCIESELLIDDILFEYKKELQLGILPKRDVLFQEDYLYSISIIALRAFLKKDLDGQNFLLSKNIEGSLKKIALDYSVSIIQPDSGLDLPIDLISSVDVVESFLELVKNINCEQVISKSSCDEKKLIFAIKISTFIMGVTLGKFQEWESVPSFSVNKSFFNTVEKLKFLNEEKKVKLLLRTISEILLGVNLKATHPLRNGKGATCQPHKKGNFTSQRTDVDYDYHLHFWKDGNNIELASLVIHEDMSIPK
jgi:hypothetical protein